MRTNGQEEIFKIVSRMSNRHKGSWGIWNCPNSSFYNEFTQIIRSNNIIQSDHITGRSLNNFGISRNYIQWIRENSTKHEIRNNFPLMSLDLFDYDRGDITTSAAFLGGDKYHTTYSCLFSLFKKITLCPTGWRWLPSKAIPYSTKFRQAVSE
jgi:hypothetical protein